VHNKEAKIIIATRWHAFLSRKMHENEFSALGELFAFRQIPS